MPNGDERNLIWLDLEMTGLDPEKDVVLEIATVVTDGQLNVLAEGPCLAIHQPDAVLDGMDPWCVEQHGKSGLTQRCRDSKVTILDAQARTLEFLAPLCAAGKSPLCGNTIGQDRRFLVKYMPRLNDFFHYRSIDVSSIKELVSRWYPEAKYVYSKSKQHLSLADVHESIDELRHYRKTVFR
jgi:oligoribonuclease